jgi:thiamine-phosphate pyrophosphorylase
VDQENIRRARSITRVPIFLSGGIRRENLGRLQHLSFDGIAIISGILNAADPESAVKQYLETLTALEIAR